MQKILMVSAEFPPHIGGIARLAQTVARGLSAAGYEVHVLSGTRGVPEHAGFEVITIPGFLSRKHLKTIPLLLKAVATCHRLRPKRLLLTKWTHEGIVGIVVKRLFGVEYVVMAHGAEMLAFNKDPAVTLLMRRCFAGARAVIAVSNYTKTLLVAAGVAETKITVIPNSLHIDDYDLHVSSDLVRRKYGLEKARVLLTVARLTRRKGHDKVLEALRDLAARYPDLVYVMTGEGSYRQQLHELIREYGLDSCVRFVGFVTHHELEQLYQACEFLIMPSREEGSSVEGFGISFLEANLFGKPVIGGNSGGVPDAIIDGVTGFLVDPTNTQDIKEKMVRLLDDGALRDAMGRAGQRRVLEELNSRRQAAKMAEILLGECAQ